MTEILKDSLHRTAYSTDAPSGCFVMAGSFGYEREHDETSMSIGEMLLFPAVRKATMDIIRC